MNELKLLSKTILTPVLIILFVFINNSINAATQEFTDEAAFIMALDGAVPTIENYETCATVNPNYAGFSLTSTRSIFCSTLCDSEGAGTSPYWRSDVTYTFASPKNAFGTFLYDIGTTGTTTLTLMTTAGIPYTVIKDFRTKTRCEAIFFGIVSDMDFVSATFTNTDISDIIIMDNTYCANVVTIPTMSQWALLILGLIMTSMAVVTIRKSTLARA